MDHVEDRIIGFEDQAEEFNNWPKKLNKSKQRSKTNTKFKCGIFKNYSLLQKEQVINCEIKELNSGSKKIQTYFK